jgi:hypothetical protein
VFVGTGASVTAAAALALIGYAVAVLTGFSWFLHHLSNVISGTP